MDASSILNFASVMSRGGGLMNSAAKAAPVVGAVAGKLFGKKDQGRIDMINHIAGGVGQGLSTMGAAMMGSGAAYNAYGLGMTAAGNETDELKKKQLMGNANLALKTAMGTTMGAARTSAESLGQHFGGGVTGAGPTTGIAGVVNAFPVGGSVRDYFNWAGTAQGVLRR